VLTSEPRTGPESSFSKAALAEARLLVSELEKLKECARPLVADREAAKQISGQYSSAWDSLEHYIRPRILEFGADWLPRDVYLTVRYSGNISPLVRSDLYSAIDEISQRLEDFHSHPSARPFIGNYPSNDIRNYNFHRAVSQLDAFIEYYRLIDEIEKLASPY
jgi:hypothetical protein